MDTKQVRLVYFSPTGTSRTVLESIAKGIAVEDVEHVNLTLPEGARQTIPPFSDELVIVAALQTPDALKDFDIPGCFPYDAAGARPIPVSPVSREDACTLCGTCASVCPSAAISVDGGVATEIGLCIRCCACIKNCPEGARVMEDSFWKDITNWLNENCSDRKEPQLFGV